MSTAVAVPGIGEELERVLIGGDLGRMTPDQRVQYVRALCDSVGLNPLQRPFDYITLQGKLTLYAKKDATDQLRAKNGISLKIVGRELVDGVYVVTTQATTPAGRTDESVGAVPLPASPADKANAMMKAETKSKRRVTLSICGLGVLDESELDTIRGAREAQQQVAEQRIEELRQPSEPEPPYTPSPDLVRELGAALEAPPTMADYEKRNQCRDYPEKKPAAKRQTGISPDIGSMILDHFGPMKERLREITGTDELYYSVLGQAGYKKSNQIPDIDEGRKVFKMLTAAKLAFERNINNRAEIAELRAKLAPERFADVLFEAGVGNDVDVLDGDDLLKVLELLRGVK